MKKQKNGFIDIIKKTGMEPESFQWHEEQIDGNDAFILQLSNTPLKFIVRNSPHDFNELDYKYTKLAPGYPLSDYQPSNTPIYPLDSYGSGSLWTDIDSIYNVFESWIRIVAKEYLSEIIEPDLWAQLEQQKSFASADALKELDFSLFTKEEKGQLGLCINEFRLQIVNNFSPSAEELKVIDDRLKYVVVALDRLPRFDWKSLLLNTVLSISVALSLDSEKGKMLYNLFKQVFLKIVYLLQ